MSEEIKLPNGLTIKLEPEEDAPSPQEDGDDGLFLVANHPQFYVPPPGMKRCPNDPEEVVELYKDTHWRFNLEAYIHSGVVLALSGEGNFPDRKWDVSQLGFVFAAKSEWQSEEEARKVALNLVETWNQYLSGDVWCWTIEDENGKELEACGGTYGLEEAKKDAIAASKSHRK